jgi:predicted DNA-binding protein (MmcQ/YjbR family)
MPLPKTGKQSSFDFLRNFALGYPEAHEEFPWGETAVKVRGKTFLFTRADDTIGLHLSVKLPTSNDAALQHSFAQRTGYGLGKSGWITARFAPGVLPPLDLLREWIDESYRAIAPKGLVASLPAVAPTAAPATATKPKAKAKKNAK